MLDYTSVYAYFRTQTTNLKHRFKITTTREKEEKIITIKPNVLSRKFVAYHLNERLITDITYTYYQNGRMYLSVSEDLYDNSIIEYNISRCNDNNLVFNTIKQAFNKVWDVKKACNLQSNQGFK